MENDTLLKGVRIPEQGFIEVMIDSSGGVVQTGKSVRYDGVDCYQPVGPELIGSAIPAVDAVEVVRCADCKYYHTEWDGTQEHYEDDYWCQWVEPNEDDYCSLGQRREDGDGDG